MLLRVSSERKSSPRLLCQQWHGLTFSSRPVYSFSVGITLRQSWEHHSPQEWEFSSSEFLWLRLCCHYENFFCLFKLLSPFADFFLLQIWCSWSELVMIWLKISVSNILWRNIISPSLQLLNFMWMTDISKMQMSMWCFLITFGAFNR